MPRLYRRLLLVFMLVLAGSTSGGLVSAQTADELTAGRQLFAEALDDEEHQRFEAAVEKYERVLKIRDTSATRYRIGLSLEGLGRPKQAIDSYAAAVHLATAADAGVARASQARIDALEPKVAHLAIRPGRPGAEVRVDGQLVAAQSLDDVRVEPGSHVITAAAPGTEPARAQVTLSEGGRAEVPLVLEPKAEKPPPPPPPPPTSVLPSVGIITAAAGGVFAIAGGVFLVLRKNAIDDLNEACPRGDCPASREKELTDTRDRALVDGPLGGALLGVGVAAIATGVVLYMLGRNDTRAAARLDQNRILLGGTF